MGGVDLSQEFLCGQFPLNIFLPCQPSVLAPLVVLLVVHVHQVGTVRRCRVDPTQQTGIHSVPQLFTNQKCLILRNLIQPCQIRATLFAALSIGHPVTVPGGHFRFRDEIAPAVVTSADPLVVLLEVERQHQHPQFHQAAKPERPWFFQLRQLCRIADPRNVGISRPQLFILLRRCRSSRAVEGDLHDVPKIILYTQRFLQHPQDLLSSSQQKHRRAVILCLQSLMQNVRYNKSAHRIDLTQIRCQQNRLRGKVL